MTCQHVWRNHKAVCFAVFQVDRQLEFSWLFDRQIRRLSALCHDASKFVLGTNGSFGARELRQVAPSRSALNLATTRMDQRSRTTAHQIVRTGY